MEHNTYYIALGSNKGDRFGYIQAAIDAVNEQLGSVRAISKVYETEAVGFTAQPFYNACIELHSYLAAEETLAILLKIERQLGRERSDNSGYESREIDLDIILNNNIVLNTKALRLPHPKMQNRQFVLQPLADIAANVKHPVLNKSVAELLEACTDTSSVKPINIWLKNPLKLLKLSKLNFLVIEGNIGAGKTSLAKMIANDFNAKLLLERFADNAFLPKFYENPKRYAFPLEMAFLVDRYQQITDGLSQLDLFKDFVVSDYDVNKSLIFSKITLEADEFGLYRKLFYQMHKDISKPDLYVYLHQSTERLKANIKKRGRQYEQNIDTEYLSQIQSGYLQFLKDQTELQTLIIDVTDKNFIENRSDYTAILTQIHNSLNDLEL